MKRFVLGVVLIGLCLSFGCNMNTDKINQLEQAIAARDDKINEMEKAARDKNGQIKQLRAAIDEMNANAAAQGETPTLRKVKWSKILANAKKMRDEDGKYDCFCVVLEKADADSVAAATQALTDKGYKVGPSPWAGALMASSPQQAQQEVSFPLPPIATVKNTKALNDDSLAEVRAVPGVKTVWPQSVLFFPAAIGQDIPGQSLYIDVKVIALPPEFFEAEKDRLDLAEFARYDGAGAQVIVPRIVVEYFNRFARYTNGLNLEYETSLANKYFKVRLASSSLFAVTDIKMKPIDIKVVGYTDRVNEVTIIVSPEVVDDWNKRLFETAVTEEPPKSEP